VGGNTKSRGIAMGEYSKSIGEQGERYAWTFLDLIGWKPRKQNFDLPCCHEHHANSKEHGVDGYYHYRSPLIDEVLDHVIISVKYSADGYGANPKSKFKDNIKQLQGAIECFERSEIKREVNSNCRGVGRSSSYGLLLWFHGNSESNPNLVSEIENVRFADDFSVTRPIFVIDRRRMLFIDKSINYVKSKNYNSKIDFFYQNTGNNLSAGEKATNDDFLPVQMLVSGSIVFRIQGEHEGDISICLCCDESFSKDALQKIIGLAQNLTLNIASKVLICFPDYQPEKHGGVAEDVKMLFENRNFANTVDVAGLRLGIL
jgi:hypothetical protein